MTMRSRSILGIFAVMSLCFQLAGCGPSPAPGGPAAPAAPPPAPVSVSQPIVKAVREWDEYTGRTEAVKSVEVRARAKGYLEKILFADGAKIQQGDLLFVIDPRPYQADLDKAQAELNQAKARLELAVNDLDRAKKLLKAQAISEEEVDMRVKGLREMQSAVTASTALVETAKLNIGYTQIRAPISGRIGRKQITEGNLVNGGGAQDTLLAYIVSIDPVYAYLDVDERSALKYRKMSEQASRTGAHAAQIPAQLALVDEEGYPHQGVIDYVEPRADPNTGTVRVRGVFPNADDRLSPGFFARVRIPGSGHYQATLIAEEAIGIDQGQKFVMVVNDKNLPEYRPIKLGRVVDGLRVVTEGLQPGDWVVVNGLQRVRPGLPVSPQRIPMPVPKPAGSAASANPAH